MCLIVVAAGLHPRYRLVVAANRDEAHGRASAPLDFWPQAPQILAGRDLEAGGTWLGVNRSGRFAAVTNFREPGRRLDGAPSRGALVADFLMSQHSAPRFVRQLDARRDQYNGFNLLLGESEELLWISNRHPQPRSLLRGLYGLSNHLLDTPWPKVERCKRRLEALLESGASLTAEAVLELLDDRRPAADCELPQTGVPIEWERLLSAPFICHPIYGTRSSSALLVGRNGQVVFSERRFDAAGEAIETRTQRMALRQAAHGGDRCGGE